MEKQSLTVAIGKLAMSGEKAGFTVEQMVRDSRDVIGHKALHSIPKGEPLNRSDID